MAHNDVHTGLMAHRPYLIRRCPTPRAPTTTSRLGKILDGFELMEPGMVPVHEWRPDGIVRETGNAYGIAAHKK